MKQVLLIAAFFFGIAPIFSQDHSTCYDAIPLKGSSYGPIIAKGWADSSLCDHTNKNMYFGKSHMVVWFSLTIQYDTTLTFEIVPENPTDDFDFMVFKADKGDFCQKEKQRQVTPIRTNFAKCTKFNDGITGLSEKATRDFVGPGYNSPLSSAIDVKKGELYYIVVDNYVDDKGGFTLRTPVRFINTKPVVKTALTPIPAKPTTPPAPPAPPPPPPQKPNFFIHVLDTANHPIKANIYLTVNGYQRGKSVKVDTTSYAIPLKKNQTLEIKANAEGYMPYESSYPGSNDDTTTVTFWAHLEPIKTGQNITIKDIQFQQDSPNILSTSRAALDYVINFLVTNKKVNILIKGYTNDPDKSQSKKYDQALSEARAESVKNYLGAHGVNKKRMECVGFGSTKMLYPHPTNEEQQVANRRVEIEIQ